MKTHTLRLTSHHKFIQQIRQQINKLTRQARKYKTILLSRQESTNKYGKISLKSLFYHKVIFWSNSFHFRKCLVTMGQRNGHANDVRRFQYVAQGYCIWMVINAFVLHSKIFQSLSLNVYVMLTWVSNTLVYHVYILFGFFFFFSFYLAYTVQHLGKGLPEVCPVHVYDWL